MTALVMMTVVANVAMIIRPKYTRLAVMTLIEWHTQCCHLPHNVDYC